MAVTEGVKILIVDDLEANLIALERLLSDLDLLVYKALSGNEALQLMLEHEFALVLMDVQMPDMDGFETVQIMRQTREFASTPVIFISAIYRDEVYNVKGIESGAVDFIVKPIVPEVLLGKVQVFVKLFEDKSHLRHLNTELQTKEKELSKIKDELLQAQEIAHVGNFTHFPYEDRHVWSKVLYEIMEIPEDTIVTLPLIEKFIHPMDLPLVKEMVLSHLNGKHKNQLEFRVKLPSGAVKYLESRTFSALDEEGNLHHVFGTVQDISLMRQMEEKLRQAEKMKAIGQLAGGIAHDFNNQLAAIMGTAELTLMQADDGEVVENGLKTILSISERVANLTKQLLSYARKGKYRNEEFDLNKVVTEVKTLLERTVDKVISLDFALDPSELLLEGDPNQVYSAILNIAINSRDAIEGEGHISISTGTKVIDDTSEFWDASDSEPGLYNYCRISDTGCGMEESVIRKAFDPFFTTKEQGKGTGMGLSAVLGIVKVHYGIIDVQSSQEEGTTFTLYFPSKKSAQLKSAEGFKLSDMKKYSGNVLVVDDEEILLDLCSMMLQTMGFTVFTATNGREGVNLFREKAKDIDLVLLDMLMPQMGGKEALIEILDINPEAKVLISTGYGGEDETLKVKELGARDIICKPFKIESLTKVIDKVLQL